jgi:histidinol dehydrogenase
MPTLTSTAPDFPARLSAFCAAAAPTPQIAATVAAIIDDIRKRGDDALTHYIAKFDRATLRPADFRIPPAELAAAARSLPRDQLRALRSAHAALHDFNRRNLPKNWSARNPHGATTGETHHPIRRVGLYIPGGQAPLASTVLHTATLAHIARCPEIAAFTPSDPAGAVAPALLAALHIAGVTEAYRIGGAQAIAAMAHGTATIPAVDKIFGPGNAYVTEAKRQVYGAVGIDALPGPSELMVIADATANPANIAADLLAQAEHGSGREQIYLIAPAQKIITAVAAQIETQLQTLPRADKIRPILATGYLAIIAPIIPEINPGKTRNEKLETRNSRGVAAAAIANHIAPEHLEIMVAPQAEKHLLRAITTAGAIFIGSHTPTALGDFTAGPSHVLPTARTARYSSGLRAADFMRRTSHTRYTPASLRKAAETTTTLATLEHLAAHARSLTIRAT